MLNRTDFAEQLLSCADGELPVRAFEDWFEESSWDVHQAGDEQLTSAVFRVESWLSAYNEGRLSAESVMHKFEELANTLPPFVVSTLKIGPSLSWAWTSSASMSSVGEAHV